MTVIHVQDPDNTIPAEMVWAAIQALPECGELEDCDMTALNQLCAGDGCYVRLTLAASIMWPEPFGKGYCPQCWRKED